MKGSSSKLWLDSLIKARQVPVLICPGKSTVGATTKKSAPPAHWQNHFNFKDHESKCYPLSFLFFFLGESKLSHSSFLCLGWCQVFQAVQTHLWLMGLFSVICLSFEGDVITYNRRLFLLKINLKLYQASDLGFTRWKWKGQSSSPFWKKSKKSTMTGVSC